MSGYEFHVPPAQRITGYQCANHHSGKVFPNVFAHDQNRNHATRGAGFFARVSAAIISMRAERSIVLAHAQVQTPEYSLHLECHDVKANVMAVLDALKAFASMRFRFRAAHLL